MSQLRKRTRVEERSCEKGFTLVELMTSLVIFSVGIFLVLESLGKSFDAVRSIDTYTRAGLLLQEKLDEISSEESTKVGMESGEFEDDESFSWESEVTETDTNNLYKVTVAIKWDRGKSLRAATYVCRQK